MSAGYDDALTYYPGPELVDIVGLDYYSDDGRFEATKEYRELLTTKHPIALTEVGQCRSSGFGCGSSNAAWIIESIREHMPEVVYFSAWNDKWALYRQHNLGGLLNDEWVVNRGGIK